MPVDNELSKQNIQDRYHGHNDPVAKKIMSTHAANMGLQPPEDQSIVSSSIVASIHEIAHTSQTSIFLTSLPASANEQRVRTRVVQSLPSIQPSQLKSVVHVAKSRYAQRFNRSPTDNVFCRCAFVNFVDRKSAEIAAQAWANGLDMDGEMLGVKWGRSKAARPQSAQSSSVNVAT